MRRKQSSEKETKLRKERQTRKEEREGNTAILLFQLCEDCLTGRRKGEKGSKGEKEEGEKRERENKEREEKGSFATKPVEEKMAQSTIVHKPTFLVHNGHRFLIMDAPTDQNLPAYVEECKKHNVSTVVRACEPTYSIIPFTNASIDVVEMPFSDGEPPPADVVKHWLEICRREFGKSDPATIAVHCVAGLGRAPVLVAINLIEEGMQALDAIEFIRTKRRGAINARQLKFLEQYVPQKKGSKGCCLLM